MSEILTFLSNIPTNAVLVIIVVAFALRDIPAIAKYIPFWNKVDKISKTQDEKYPEIQKHFELIEKCYADQNKWNTNHSMHEIPEIKQDVKEMKGDMKDIKEAVSRIELTHEVRLAKLETKLEK